jgi:hypothetical protein
MLGGSAGTVPLRLLPNHASSVRCAAARLPPRVGRGGRYLAVASGVRVRRREVIRMSCATLAVISLVAIVGPLLALPRRWHLRVILRELVAGIVLGTTGSDACRRATDVHVPG